MEESPQNVPNMPPAENTMADNKTENKQSTKSLLDSLKGNKRIMLVGGGALVIFTCLLILCLLLGLGSLSSFLPGSSDDTPVTPTETADDGPVDFDFTDEDDDPDVVTPPSLPHIVFYQLGNIIYSYNVLTETETEVYTFDPADYDDITNVRSSIFRSTFIDEETLGLHICDVVEGDYNCGLFVLDASTGTLTEKEDRGANDFVLTSGFLDEDNFVYFYEDTGAPNGRQVLVGTIIGSGGTETGFLLDELSIPGPAAYGRGGFEADDTDIRYSPEGTYLAFIQTSNVVDGFDFNIRMYDMESKGSLSSLPIVEDATHPFWISNTELAYRVYGEDGTVSDYADIEIYNFATDSNTSLNIPSEQRSLRGFSVIGNRYLYANDNFDLYIYNSSTGNGDMIMEMVANPHWIDAEHIIYTPVETCAECFDGYDYLGPVIYDLEEDAVLKTLDDDVYNYLSAYSD